MEKKALRVAAIIETTEGVLVVQDAKDKRRDYYMGKLTDKLTIQTGKRRNSIAKRIGLAQQIVQDGRFSLPGGKIEPKDYEEAGATSIMDLDNPQTPEEIELFLQVIRSTLVREIDEELKLHVNQGMIKSIMEIQGRTRDHIICLVHAVGVVKINRAELSGIGFLDEKSPIPLNEYFFQSHLRIIHQKYIKSPLRQEYITRYLSRINISEELVMGAYRDTIIGYKYALSAPHRNNKHLVMPHMPHSSPNFLIYDDKKQLYRPHTPASFTETVAAKIVPPSPDFKKPLPKKKSDPQMTVVKVSSAASAPIDIVDTDSSKQKAGKK